ncbi:isocitrate/isopropylmalate dehydrogenase family protein [Stigmatella aurantiaca]|uniref:3-isopropylmalate dehydrogenase n=1 Tax=Stigmatella aurantiaca (strain DW4/3-1) TaxID=378806 RepID=Q08ME8_STIAD|nr:isocitrate/isopropylmalate dehydrogenase family protein [Stigmatella aurantiaca]ADO72652.1 3-isopropylmalate dehydrogenase [Stigmatella aurantiaca DW4/3-1]EAU61658.1 3-isopropylmalate dehydrogenase [Stigmatella aurantiaca DW4/3-1]
MTRIAVIPGDGVGAEVMGPTLRLLQTMNVSVGLGLVFDSFDFGAERYLKTGVALPAGQLETFREDYDAILLGAVGDARIPDGAHARELLLGLRFGLDLYINFRPCRLYAESLCPLKGKHAEQIDFVVFRENTEGQYNGIGGFLKSQTGDEVAISTEVNTRKGVERLVRAAFAWARRKGKRRVALGDKSNAIPAHQLWRRVFQEVAAEYPELEARHLYVDNLALQLVQRPESFEVIVTTNLFGDILTDLGAALVGGLGLGASANLNPDSTPLFEPVHGSAPDLVGQGRVNPMAMFLTAGLMLEELGHGAQAARLERAVARAILQGQVTPDLGGSLSTTEVTEAVLGHLEAPG